MRKETAFLNDVTDPASQHVDVVRCDFGAAESDGAGIGFDEPDNQAQQSRFPATTRSDQNGRSATLNGEIGWVQRRRVSVALAKIDKLNQRIHCCSRFAARSVMRNVFQINAGAARRTAATVSR